jgi:hypothetical protein
MSGGGSGAVNESRRNTDGLTLADGQCRSAAISDRSVP